MAAKDNAGLELKEEATAEREMLFFDADMDGKRQEARRFFQKLDQTKEWAENNYYHLPIEQQLADLVTVNEFWADYAAHEGAGPFLSKNCPQATRNFTELMLALAPECVHMERAVANFPPEFPCPTLSKGRPAAAWASYDFGPSGVIGDPTPATREQGEGLLDSLAASWAQAIIEIHRMAWVERREPTWGKQHWHGFVQSLPPSIAADSQEP